MKPSLADLARWLRLSPSTARRLLGRYGVELRAPPSARELRRARSWRNAPTLAEAWKRFAAAAEERDDLDVVDDECCCRVEIQPSRGARALVVAAKSATMMFLRARRPGERSVGEAAGVALAHAFGPADLTAPTLRAFARERRIPLWYMSDLDPGSIHSFAKLRRALGRLPIRWIGVNDALLDAAANVPTPRKLPVTPFRTLDPFEREHWVLLQKLVPDARRIVGPDCASLLDHGLAFECERKVLELGPHLADYFRNLLTNQSSSQISSSGGTIPSTS